MRQANALYALTGRGYNRSVVLLTCNPPSGVDNVALLLLTLDAEVSGGRTLKGTGFDVRRFFPREICEYPSYLLCERRSRDSVDGVEK
ncbi:hypothetical protein J6590_099179 [Homalodisca vitripennis]|nr:hypothetical protein J6590_099179 [Homalodisca vitripennis]